MAIEIFVNKRSKPQLAISMKQSPSVFTNACVHGCAKLYSTCLLTTLTNTHYERYIGQLQEVQGQLA